MLRDRGLLRCVPDALGSDVVYLDRATARRLRDTKALSGTLYPARNDPFVL
jgi:hypothetical protein